MAPADDDLTEHARIVELFRDVDAAGAAAVLESYILRTRDSYASALRRRGSAESGSKRDRLMHKRGVDPASGCAPATPPAEVAGKLPVRRNVPASSQVSGDFALRGRKRQQGS